MPIVNADVKNLEGCTFADLAKDAVMIKEITEKEDLHSNNQRDFNLPSRLVAKRFLFKLVYGATAYGFFTDPDFLFMGYSEKRWQEVIDTFYKKYSGGAKWHQSIINEAQRTGRLTIPSGRYFPFSPERRYNGELKWPITQIKNYPVQGFGADLVMLARLEGSKRLRSSGLEASLISTVHDSIVADCRSEDVEAVGRILYDSIACVPKLCKQVWDYDFSVPITSEVQFGTNKKDMQDLTLT